MKVCEIINIIIIIIIKYTFVVLISCFSCSKTEEATRDRRKLNSEEFDGFAKYSCDQTNEVVRDGASVL